MIRDLPTSALAVLAVLISSAVARADDPPADVRIGLIQGLFRDIQPAMMQALAKPFRELMTKQTGYTGDVEICEDPLDMAEKLKAKKLHLAVFHGFEFAWAKKVCPELQPLIVTIPPGGKVQACVVVHKNCPAAALSGLEDESIIIPRGAKSHSLAYLQKIRAGLGKNVAKPVTKVRLTVEDALNELASAESTAVLVDSAALEGYKTLQPGAFKQLKILCQSELFPPAVVAYHKNSLTEEQVSAIRSGMTEAQKNPTGKMLMMMWNLKGFEAAPENYQSQLDSILKAYPLPEKPVSTGK